MKEIEYDELDQSKETRLPEVPIKIGGGCIALILLFLIIFILMC